MKTFEEVRTKSPMPDNGTYNTCPGCLSHWKDKKAVPGLLHRTKLCHKCRRGKKN